MESHIIGCRNEEFIDKEMTMDHKASTGHEIIERTLEK
jgi:hypothetical protein